MLYQLSYIPVPGVLLAKHVLYQLSYTPRVFKTKKPVWWPACSRPWQS